MVNEKKVISLLVLVVFMIGIVGSPVSAAKANVDVNAGMAGFTQEQV